MRKTFLVPPVFGLFAALSFAGCSSSNAGGPAEQLVPVWGVVQIDGKPQAGVQVTFFPARNTKGRGGTGVTDDAGEFRMRNSQNKSGIPVGEYIATFSMNSVDGQAPRLNGMPIPGMSFKEKIPTKWSDPLKAGSHNKVIVPDGGIKDLSFKITVK